MPSLRRKLAKIKDGRNRSVTSDIFNYIFNCSEHYLGLLVSSVLAIGALYGQVIEESIIHWHISETANELSSRHLANPHRHNKMNRHNRSEEHTSELQSRLQ